MKSAIRTIGTTVTAVGAFYFVFWASGALLLTFAVTKWAPTLIAALAAVGAARLVWIRSTVAGSFVSAICPGRS
jgi:hypothetical protein